MSRPVWLRLRHRLSRAGVRYDDLATVVDAQQTAEFMAGRSLDWWFDPAVPDRMWAEANGARYEIRLVPAKERRRGTI